MGATLNEEQPPTIVDNQTCRAQNRKNESPTLT